MSEKPERLYHASPRKDLEVIEPQQKSARDPEEGPRVFATPDRKLAPVFMVPVKETSSGYIRGNPYFVALREEFLEQDKGGSIYHLHPEGFETDPNKGLGVHEWTASAPMRPIEKEDYESGLHAMIEAGVRVYLVDPDTMRRLREAEDPSHIVDTLQSE